ncbi:MAG: hypothetical protein ACR2PF_18735 [Rhizobiaceae bacterium]
MDLTANRNVLASLVYEFKGTPALQFILGSETLTKSGKLTTTRIEQELMIFDCDEGIMQPVIRSPALRGQGQLNAQKKIEIAGRLAQQLPSGSCKIESDAEPES